MIASAPIFGEDVLVSVPLDAGWELASTPEPATPAELNGLRFVPAQVPGTVASALRAQKSWRMGDGAHFDASEHWFRCRFDAEAASTGEELILRLGGIATIAEIWLNGEKIAKTNSQTNSMFAAHEVDVSALIRDRNELLIACRSLSAALRERRGRKPAPRWRTRVVAEQQLRWFRTTLLGRAPGFAPEPEPVGPWRPVTLLRRRRVAVENWTRHAGLDGSAGVIGMQFKLRILDDRARPVAGRLLAGDASAAVEWNKGDGFYNAQAAVRIPNVIRWWPHTHGAPFLYPVRIELKLADGSTARFEDLPAGFRIIETSGSEFGLNINGAPVFCRGVVWTPPDIAALSAPEAVIRDRLQLLREAGFNLIRLAGTTFYESEIFHRLCDELGFLVWQDMMFANMDYPFQDSAFHETVSAEAEAELSRLSRHASTSVICGNSEIEQQAAMLGLDPAVGRGEFFGDELPRIAARCCPGVPYIPSAPCGGDLPFRARTGIANYFGVGAYLRPIEDARRSQVRFASECLAFSNVPEPEMIEKMALPPAHPAWKRSVPRDSGAGWDFEDVRDHYLKLLYSADPVALRYSDAGRYWELSRMVSGEVMAEVFGEWRRRDSVCNGGIVLWAADLEPGAGWGVLDSQGWPKAAYWFLKRALAPCTVWTTDEGLNGIDVHVANDRPDATDVSLRLALYRSGEQRVAGSDRALTIPPNTTMTFGLEDLIGRFVDASYAYRFGPPGHDVIAASLHSSRDGVPFAQTFRFPAGRTMQRVPISELGLSCDCRTLDDGNGIAIEALAASRRFAWGVRVAAPGWLPDDAYFGIEPGATRRIVLRPTPELHPRPQMSARELPSNLAVTAVNAEGRLRVALGSHA